MAITVYLLYAVGYETTSDLSRDINSNTVRVIDQIQARRHRRTQPNLQTISLVR